jgi:hypothetical protein
LCIIRGRLHLASKDREVGEERGKEEIWCRVEDVGFV